MGLHRNERRLAVRSAGIILAAVWLVGCTGGPYWARSSNETVGPGWVVATGFARAADPAAAAAEAARAAEQQLGNLPAATVIFFECFADVPGPQHVAAAVRAVFPRAQIIGCSAAGVATRDGASGDRAVALLALANPAGDRTGCRFSSAYAPGAMPSADAAARTLARQLDARSNQPAAIILLASPASVAQPTWDANDLLTGLGTTLAIPSDQPPPAAGRVDQPAAVFGGLASPRGPRGAVRLYHQGQAYPDGAVALQIVGPLSWSADTRSELLRVGPTWQAHLVQDRRVGQLTSGEQSLSADAAIAKLLIAQERVDGHVARIVGNRDVPLRFTPAEAGAISLPVRVADGERLVVLESGPAEGRVQALRQGLIETSRQADRTVGLPITLLALPAGPNDSYVDELDRVREELAQPAHTHPAPIAFLGPGQFAPVADLGGVASPYFHQHTVALLQLAQTAATPGGEPANKPQPAPPTTAPEQ